MSFVLTVVGQQTAHTTWQLAASTRTLSRVCHNYVRIRRYSGGRLETVLPGQSGSRLIARQDLSADVRLGVKWSQVQILSARHRSEALFTASEGAFSRLYPQHLVAADWELLRKAQSPPAVEPFAAHIGGGENLDVVSVAVPSR
jgi:hypothetical protein